MLMFTFIFNLYSRMSKGLSVGDLVDDDFVNILVGQKCHKSVTYERT